VLITIGKPGIDRVEVVKTDDDVDGTSWWDVLAVDDKLGGRKTFLGELTVLPDQTVEADMHEGYTWLVEKVADALVRPDLALVDVGSWIDGVPGSYVASRHANSAAQADDEDSYAQLRRTRVVEADPRDLFFAVRPLRPQ